MRWLALWPMLIVMAISVYTDLRSRRIPNWLVFPCMLTGVIANCICGGTHGFLESLYGLLLGIFVMGFFAWLGGMGMGDVKLCAGMGAWLGPQQFMVAMVLTGIVGGIMALIWAVKERFVKDLFLGAIDLLLGVSRDGVKAHRRLVLNNPETRKMPYAPAIALGTLMSFLSLTPNS